MLSPTGWTTAHLALGSNLGDRLSYIEQACILLRSHPAINVKRTSSLYETKPMYVEDQGDFYNAAVEIETNLKPIPLLDAVQHIETSLNRRRTVEKGPRTIDLDILLYGDEVVEHERLSVPHKLMHERRFVLEPLCDLVPDKAHPATNGITFQQLLTRLPPSDPPITPITPLGPDLILRPQDPKRRTQLMSILNVTPDSFSDGGVHWPASPESPRPSTPSVTGSYDQHFRSTIRRHINAGASIIDIGGQSTRPNATFLSAEEELERVLPAVRAAVDVIASLPFTHTNTHARRRPRPVISIDTFHASVFSSVLQSFPPHSSGTNFILNDISAGLLSSNNTLSSAAAHSTPIILGHTRGTPTTMSKPPHTHYPHGIIPTIASELAGRVAAAEEAGVPRWRILLDPGLGFAKVGGQNLDVLRGLAGLRYGKLRGLPFVGGASRKGFLGGIVGEHRASLLGDDERSERSEHDGSSELAAGNGTGRKEGKEVTKVPPEEREWATAAAVTACVQQGVDVVRIHDVKAMGEVVAVADGVYRR